MITHFVAYLLNELNESDTYSCHLILYYYLVCLLIFALFSFVLHFFSLAALCVCFAIANFPCRKTLFTGQNDRHVVKFVLKAALSPTSYAAVAAAPPVYDFVCVCFLPTFCCCFSFFSSIHLSS